VKRTLRQKAQQIKKYAKEEERSLCQRKTMQATGTADVLGVTYIEGREQPWRVYFSCRGVVVLDAFFATKRDACLAYDACGRFLYGSFACCNFSVDGSFYRAPYEGKNAGRKQIYRTRAASIQSTTDTEMIDTGIFCAEQAKH